MNEALSADFPDARAAYMAGARQALPLLAGTIPFGLMTGIATKAAGLTLAQAIAMTVMVFAGTAQIATLPLMVAGAPIAVIVLTAFIVNLRFVIYSAGAAPHFGHLSLRWKLVLGYFMTDTGYALLMRKLADRPGVAHAHWFFLGAGTLVASVWMGASVIGVLAGTGIPPAWRLEFAATLGILALLAPFVRGRAELAAALTAAMVALAAAGLPMKLGLLVGALAGMGVGTLLDRGD